MGDGVLVYFGYPQAHEEDAEDAVRAGLVVIEAVERLQIGDGPFHHSMYTAGPGAHLPWQDGGVDEPCRHLSALQGLAGRTGLETSQPPLRYQPACPHLPEQLAVARSGYSTADHRRALGRVAAPRVSGSIVGFLLG